MSARRLSGFTLTRVLVGDQQLLLDYHLSHVEATSSQLDAIHFFWYEQKELARGARILAKVQAEVVCCCSACCHMSMCPREILPAID